MNARHNMNNSNSAIQALVEKKQLVTKSFLKKYVSNIKIDYIFPYVNYNDKEWYENYIKYVQKESEINTCNNIVRYKDYGVLEYKLKSIYKNMSWINNVFIIGFIRIKYSAILSATPFVFKIILTR